MNGTGTLSSSKPAATHAATYRGLVARGLAPEEAANLVAVLAGIPITDQPWRLREVSHLRFLKWVRETGRWGSNDGA